MRGARPTSLLLGALAAVASGCGAVAQERPPSIQASLRDLASTAPAGDRAYWLGPEFHGAPVRFADASWGRFALLTYHEPSSLDVEVESFRSHADAAGAGFRVRVRSADGQSVVLLFHTPAHPSAGLIAAARNALRPIPVHVTYPG